MLVISNRPRASRSSDFEITRSYSLNCTPLGPITITYGRHVARLRRRRAYAPTTMRKSAHGFPFLCYEYGAPLGGRRSSAIKVS